MKTLMNFLASMVFILLFANYSIAESAPDLIVTSVEVEYMSPSEYKHTGNNITEPVEFIRQEIGTNYITVDFASDDVGPPKTTESNGDNNSKILFPKRPAFFKIGKDTPSYSIIRSNIEASVSHPNGKTYFFVGNRYYRFNFKSDRVDKIGTIGVHGWRGLPASIDASVSHPNGKTYFFVGNRYYRFDFKSDRVDKVGTIGVHGWRGLPANIDAAVSHPNGKTYFFVGNRYYRFDFKSDRVDKVGTIGVHGWRGLPANIDAAASHPNGKTYFFVGNRYYRFDFKSDRVDKVGTIGVHGWQGLPN